MSVKGYFYILTNPSMPDVVKIGKTTRGVVQRASELYQTGVPTPFLVYSEIYSPDCGQLEIQIHAHLNNHRVSKDREFFRISPLDALKNLEDCHREQVEIWLEEFIPDQTIAPIDLMVCDAHINILADALRVPPPTVAEAMGYLTAEDMKAALKKHNDRKRLMRENDTRAVQ